jgi:DNA-binding NarL/FixJ family response regulator
VMQLQGAWPSAMAEAKRACEGSEEPGKMPWAGAALYRQAELHRLRGDYASAEAAYREANLHGETTQPGLALLRLAQGRGDAATSGLLRVLTETPEGLGRAKLLASCVEVLLALGNVEAAEHALNELEGIIEKSAFPLLAALGDQAAGAVLLARGEYAEALGQLRKAWSAWHAMDVPYEAARVRVLIGQACRGLGDDEGSQLELEAALAVFRELGAQPDVERVTALSGTGARREANGLTAREVEVLRLVATGLTNRQIAEQLVLSEKTVARHVSNIFGRLGISSRSAATAYAYEHGFIDKGEIPLPPSKGRLET